MFPIAGKSALATEGSYYVGARVPYTQGGMVDGQPDELNLFGVLNTGFRWRTNGIQYDVQGSSFRVRGGEVNFEENPFGDQSVGVIAAASGIDMYTATRAYRSASGTVFGNAVHRFDAPCFSNAAGTTSTMGYLVAPGNSANDQGNLFIGASSGTVVPDLSGDRADLRKLGSNIEILSGINPQISSWKTAPVPTDPALEWLRLSAGTPNSFINVDGNAANRFFTSNPNAGNAAVASIGARQIATSSPTGVRVEVYGTGFASTGPSVADGAALISDTGLSGGLSVAALTGNLRLTADGEVVMTGLPTSAPAVSGALWVDTAAGRVLKVVA
jgi:hypothetical protein